MRFIYVQKSFKITNIRNNLVIFFFEFYNKWSKHFFLQLFCYQNIAHMWKVKNKN